jgi:uncharacterized membrane protein
MTLKWGCVLAIVYLVTTALQSQNRLTITLMLSSLTMFAICAGSAFHLMGRRTALKFIVIALCLGWFAEEMGATQGWFFGKYHYSDLLGRKLGHVPIIIPMMWFAYCYIGYVMANLIVWQDPVASSTKIGRIAFMAFLAAGIVTAFDLGADPYFVYELKAWIMQIKNGDWFGEPAQGFLGWMVVAFSIIFSFKMATRSEALPSTRDFSKLPILLPLLIYACMMIFQIVFFSKSPTLIVRTVEIPYIAMFAMGIPLVCALAGWYRWKPVAGSSNIPSPVSDAKIEYSRFQTDPLADATIASIVGPWASPITPESQAIQLTRIGLVNQEFWHWETNKQVQSWQPHNPDLPHDIRLALESYLTAGHVLPDWADQEKIKRAEAIFFDHGILSCTILYCASLPECYVLSNSAEALQATAQLVNNTEHRIRTTAAMLFPVMLKGGMLTEDGSGVAQILKVRLIHAIVRNMILHGSPEEAMRLLSDQHHSKGAGILPPLPLQSTDGIYQALAANGWKIVEYGLPSNQEQLAYTLLTFSYVFLRSMRTLGIGLSSADEEAYLHIWNVVGHVLGIRREFMVDTMPEAAALFTQIQEHSRTQLVTPDPRPSLGQALMNAMRASIPFGLFQLCGPSNSNDIGVYNTFSWPTNFLYKLSILILETINSGVRFLLPHFSISRLLIRILGYHFIRKIVLDQTKPLRLPTHLINSMNTTIGDWSNDPKAPGWVNAIEDHFTTTGNWTESRK